MPLYPLPWQGTSSVAGQERRAIIGEAGSRLRMAQEHLARLRVIDQEGILPGVEAVVADMLALKKELESHGFKYTMPAHLEDQYDSDFAPKKKQI